MHLRKTYIVVGCRRTVPMDSPIDQLKDQAAKAEPAVRQEITRKLHKLADSLETPMWRLHIE